jgi:hypothetical protein
MRHSADLYAADLSGAMWRTSSYTANNNDCVEVADIPGSTAPPSATRKTATCLQYGSRTPLGSPSSPPCPSATSADGRQATPQEGTEMRHSADLYAVDLGDAVWRTSSYTANNGQCVEVADLPSVDGTAVRDSKNRHLPPVRVSRAAWAAFVTAAATGNLR